MPSGGGICWVVSGAVVVPVFMPAPSGVPVPLVWPGVSVMSPGVVSGLGLVPFEAGGFVEPLVDAAGSLGLELGGFACWLLFGVPDPKEGPPNGDTELEELPSPASLQAPTNRASRAEQAQVARVCVRRAGRCDKRVPLISVKPHASGACGNGSSQSTDRHPGWAMGRRCL